MVATYHLKALDDVGGQALYEHNGAWYRIAADDDWEPVQLPDRRAAVRCTLLATYEARDVEYQTLDALVDEVWEAWDATLDIPNVPLVDIIHLFLPEHRRQWEDERRARTERESWLSKQVGRLREAWEQHCRTLKPPPPAPPRPAPYPPDVAPESRLWEWVLTFARAVATRMPPAFPSDIDDIASSAAWLVFDAMRKDDERRYALWADERRLRAFIATSVRHMSMDSFRAMSAKRRRTVSIDVPGGLEPEDQSVMPPDEPTRAFEIREALTAAIAQLPEPEATVIRMSIEFGWPWFPPWSRPKPPPWPSEEIAAALGVSRKAVWRYRSQALKRLRLLLRDLEDDLL